MGFFVGRRQNQLTTFDGPFYGMCKLWSTKPPQLAQLNKSLDVILRDLKSRRVPRAAQLLLFSAFRYTRDPRKLGMTFPIEQKLKLTSPNPVT